MFRLKGAEQEVNFRGGAIEYEVNAKTRVDADLCVFKEALLFQFRIKIILVKAADFWSLGGRKTQTSDTLSPYKVVLATEMRRKGERWRKITERTGVHDKTWSVRTLLAVHFAHWLFRANTVLQKHPSDQILLHFAMYIYIVGKPA